ncbi:hypothetical protein NEQG_02093 [Nematocida parisii ERTm3]|uniref:Uncharacterized protein n=1 Tax=Nematocida parisii (strain ERTm3) TaxID=935791 RepID=I3EE99_NEMP3|nr:hypothetical protein NEQG_02093 [Nematocida parisii ERTm3]
MHRQDRKNIVYPFLILELYISFEYSFLFQASAIINLNNTMLVKDYAIEGARVNPEGPCF